MSKELTKKPLTEMSEDQLDQVTGGTDTQDIKQITKRPTLKSANPESNSSAEAAFIFKLDKEEKDSNNNFGFI